MSGKIVNNFFSTIQPFHSKSLAALTPRRFNFRILMLE